MKTKRIISLLLCLLLTVSLFPLSALAEGEEDPTVPAASGDPAPEPQPDPEAPAGPGASA